ncbi:hypothetical protein ACWDBF_20125 [Streptomyces angustmyceticus]
MTTPPAYGADARATGTGTVSVSPAPAAPGTHPHLAAVRPDGTRGTVFLAPGPALRPAPAVGPVRAVRPTPAVRPTAAVRPAQAVRLTPAVRPDGPAEAAPRRELSSTSAVGLVLAGGAILVIAGQLLRLRLRLRRERHGDADEH